MSPLWVAVCWGHSLLIRCKNGHVSRPSHGPSTPLDTHTGRTVHDYMCHVTKCQALTALFIPPETLDDSGTLRREHMSMREHRTSIAMVSSVLSDIGVERHVRVDSAATYTDTT